MRRPLEYRRAAICGVLLFGVTVLQADPPRAVMDLLAHTASALSANNVPAFLNGVDPAMPEYSKLKADVTTLLEEADVGSSVVVQSDKGNDRQRELELDWYLEIKSQEPEGPSERRRQIVHCRVEKQNGKWKIVALEPLDLFAPLAVH